MDNGVVQFLVIAAFVVLSIIDGAARKRKAAESEAAGHEDGEGPDEQVRAEYLRTHGTTDGDDWEESGDFAEVGPGGFAPARPAGVEEVWEEVARLVRGEEPPPTETGSFEQAGQALIGDGPPLVEERYEAETMARYPVVRRSQSPVVEAEEYVRPHQDEAPHVHSVAPDVWRTDGDLAAEMPDTPGKPRKTARGWLAGADGHSTAALRRGIVLHAVFGPPVSLKNSENPGKE